jgi:hypothetical protein
MKITEVPYYEVRLYIGSREGYHGEQFGQRDLMRAVRQFQEGYSQDNLVSVRYSKCTYQVGNWDEEGWEIAAINYPRFPKSTNYLNEWFMNLAKFLCKNLHQNRITVCTPYISTTVEIDGAEERHHDSRLAGDSTAGLEVAVQES